MPLLLRLAATAAGLATVAADAFIAPPPKHVIHVVADDLGYHDVHFRNKQATQTPFLDELAANGVVIPEFYVYKMCSPSRNSVLSGRYPWHVGYYDNNGGFSQGLPLTFDMLPAVIKKASPPYASHALGKWHAGWLFRNHTPTWRGFDTFYGSSGNTEDYWQHTSSDHACGKSGKLDAADFIDAVAPFRMLGDHYADHPPLLHPDMASARLREDGYIRPVPDMNGTYDSVALTRRAIGIVQQHNATMGPLYMYLAYHNVHVPMHAPLETVDRFATVRSDARKVANAMLLELDWGVSNVSAALDTAGMLNDTLFIVHTDNGGPGSHACNYPLRGGKFSFWEGGLRGLALVGGRPLPPTVRGTNFNGLMHLTDIYATIAIGFAGVDPDVLSNTGPIPPDGHNMWPALSSGGLSPRTEVIHLPIDAGMPKALGINASLCGKDDVSSENPEGHGCSPSLRMGRYKLVFTSPGDDKLWTLDPTVAGVPYGKDGGIVYPPGSDHAIGPHWSPLNTSVQHSCLTFPNSSMLPSPCLFDVVADPSETHNLNPVGMSDPSIVHLVKNMTARLIEVSATAAPYCDIVDPEVYEKVYAPLMCKVMLDTGFWLPVDWNGTIPPPPQPPQQACTSALKAACPGPFSSPVKCLTCTRQAPTVTAACSPKDRQQYCNSSTLLV